LNSAAAQCHWSYRTIFCSYMSKWQTSDRDRPAVWWPHWPEIHCKMPTVKAARTLRLCCVLRHYMQCSAACNVLMVQVLYNLRNRPVQCHVQNVSHRSQPLIISVLDVRSWTVFMSFKQPHDISLGVFPVSCVLALGIRSKMLWCHFLCLMRSVILAHLVLVTTNSLFTHSLHWLMFSGTFRLTTVVITSTTTIVSHVCPVQSQIFTICPNVCNHLPSNMASYNRRKVSIFIPLCKPINDVPASIIVLTEQVGNTYIFIRASLHM